MFASFRADDIASQLQDGEPIERDVVEERLDHPVAIGRDAVVLIAVVADRVGVADEVEPPGSQPLRMPRRDEQPIHQQHVAIRPGVGEKGVDLRRRRRQAGEVERDPADERERIGVGGRCEALALDASEHEAVDPGVRPIALLDGRSRMVARRHVCPVRRVGGAGRDPLGERLLLG